MGRSALIQLNSTFEGHHRASAIQKIKFLYRPWPRTFEANRVLAATEVSTVSAFFVPGDRSRALDRRRSTLYAAHAHKDIELVRELSFVRNAPHHRHVNEG